MANGHAHSFAGTAVGLAVPMLDKEAIKDTPELLVAGPLVGNFFGKLPDIIEPAFKNPHHRQFFHSIAVLAAVAGYLSHLALDAITPRSLPLVGRL